MTTINNITKLSLHVPNKGVWVAEIEAPPVSVSVGDVVDFVVGGQTWTGTLSDESGVFVAARYTVLGGAGNWGATVPARHYHSDAGVQTLVVAQDLASSVGETLGDFLPAASRIEGTDYAVNDFTSASSLLEDIIGPVSWWVDSAGTTHVGTRPVLNAVPGFTLQAYDPMSRVATLAAESAPAIGATIRDPRLQSDLVIKSYTLVAQTGSLTVEAYCGPADDLIDVLKSIVTRCMDQRLLGCYRYRVSSMSGSRMNLEVANSSSGVPTMLEINQYSGVGGAFTEALPGQIVLVSFVEGKRSLPVVLGFDLSSDPERVVFFGGTRSVARVDDTVSVAFATTHRLTLVQPPEIPSPQPGVGTYAIQLTPPDIDGTITSGTDKVKA